MDKIRVRLRGFDVELIEQSARAIVDAVQKQGTKVSGPVPSANQDQQVHRSQIALRKQEVARTVRDANPQEAHRHP